MKRKFFSIFFALVLVLSFSLVTAVPVAGQEPETLNVAPFILYQEGSGVPEWSTESAHSGTYSVKLKAPEPADYAKVKMAISGAFSSFTAPSFYYKISSEAVRSTRDTLESEGLTRDTATFTDGGYLSPYPVIHISDGTTHHWIIGQLWAEDTQVDWTEWDNTQASHVYDEAYWHDDTGAQVGNMHSLSYWTDYYSTYDVVDVGIGLGSFGAEAPETMTLQSAYVDSLTINTTTYDLEEPEYTSIQEAVNAANPAGGDTIIVAAGTYELSTKLSIDKPLSLLGPNAGINPNTETRVDEAVLIPGSSRS